MCSELFSKFQSLSYVRYVLRQVRLHGSRAQGIK